MKKILFSFLLVTAFSFCSQAQLVANAGPDFTITECAVSYKQIGGSPTASGGTPPYTYSWTLRRWYQPWYPLNYQNSSSNPTITGGDVNTVGLNHMTSFSSTDSFFVLRVTDALGATATDTVFFDVVPIAVSRSVTNQSAPGVCDGAIQATISGGTPPLSIVWSKPALTPSISGLCPGPYTLAITDVQGCTSTTTDMVECAPGTFNLTLTTTGASCNGGSNGTICANIVGGTPGYTYTWSNGATTQCPNNFSAGSYIVTVSDANSCTATATGTVTQPPPINLSIVKTGNGIYPDTLDLTVSAGCAPYIYNWKNGPVTQDRSISGTGYYRVTVTDCSGCSNTGSINVGNVLVANAGPDVYIPVNCWYSYMQIGGSPTGLGGTPPYRYRWTPASYLSNDTIANPNVVSSTFDNPPLTDRIFILTVTDALGITARDTVFVDAGPSTISASISMIGNTHCVGAGIIFKATGSGGAPPYRDSWGGGQWIFGDGGWGGGRGNNTIPHTYEAPGTYIVSVGLWDTMGCSARDTLHLAINQVTTTTTVTAESIPGACDASIASTVSGGTPPYSYYWINSATTPTITGLCAGHYPLIVTDVQGCTSTTIDVLNSLVPVADAGPDQTICFGSSVAIGGNPTGFGGTPPYTYSWAPSTGISCATCANPTVNPGVSVTYQVTLTDSLGATATDNVTILVGNLQINSITTDISCNGSNDGSICINASGGAPPFSYLWNNSQVVQCAGNLSAGNYTVTVTDSNGCSGSASESITEPAALIATSSHTDLACNGSNNGTLTITISGGTPPYNYLGNPIPPGTSTIPGLAAGTYSGNVIDANGCSFAVSETILEPSALIITETHVNVFCSGGNTGAIDVTVSGGAVPYTYTWNDGAVTEDRNNLAAGSYSITVADNNVCSASISIVIGSNSAVSITETHTNISCFGESTGSINVLAIGGVSPYSYLWNDGNVSQNRTALPAGNYSLTVTDNNVCSASLSVTLSEPPLLDLQVVSATSGALPDTLCVTVTGGTPSYLYNWGGNVTGLPNLCFELLSGAFSFSVTDANGCTDSFSTNSLCPNNCVWPGDADYNGIADNNDLLPIGLAYGKIGPARTQQDINWYAHVAQDWIDTVTTTGSGSTGNNIITVASSAGISLGMAVSGTGIAGGAVVTSMAGTTFALSKVNTGAVSGTLIFTTPSISSGVNSKQIDCDGNGTINADDTTAIIQNFGSMHAKTEDERGWRMTDPGLYVELDPDTTQAGDTLYADLTLGDVNVPATDVYGLAFTLNYDAAVVDSSQTRITFGNSWFGTAIDKISIDKNFHTNGQLKCALTRIDHTTRSGFGPIGQAQFVITTDNINGKDLAYYQMNVWISDLVMIDNLGNYITVNQGRDSSQVEFEPVGIADIGLRNADFKIQPNPANDEVQILVTEELVGGELKIMDVEGRILMQSGIQTQNSKLKTQNFSQGIYFVRIKTEKGMLTKRLVIAR